MSIKVYNTLTKQKEDFVPVNPPKVGIYLCGPTVYKPSHIGHAVGPIIFDAIIRHLKYRGFDVRWVVNITDVDDKLIAESAKQGRPMLEIAREVEADYKECVEKLGIRNITDWPRATEYIDKIIELVQRLIDNGAAYVVNGDVYFDHTAAKDYGKLSGRHVDEAQHGSRSLAGENKKHPADFAVWKASKEGEPAWDSPWGKGRPGWHIECSAMSMSLLGETFDIHGGGIDLIFPHHENEIAQSEAATGKKPFAKYWMHNGLTRIVTKAGGGKNQTEKMSKSLGNIREISDLLKEYPGEVIRAFVLSTHYRRPLDFSNEQLKATQKALERFYRIFAWVEQWTWTDVYTSNADIDEIQESDAHTAADVEFINKVKAHKKQFFDEMDNDFNTAGAMAALYELAGSIDGHFTLMVNSRSGELQLLANATVTLRKLGNILGLFETKLDRFLSANETQEMLNKCEQGGIQKLIDERNAARKAKDFARADEIRDQLAEMGITIEDTAGGTIWRRS